MQVAPPPQPTKVPTPEFPPPIVFDPPPRDDAPPAPETDPWLVPLGAAATAAAPEVAQVEATAILGDHQDTKAAKRAKKAKEPKELKEPKAPKGRRARRAAAAGAGFVDAAALSADASAAELLDQPAPPSFPPPSAPPVIDVEPERDLEPWPVPSGPPSAAAAWVQLALAGDGGADGEPPGWTTDQGHRRRRVGAVVLAACGVALGLGTTLFLLRDDGGGEAKRSQVRTVNEPAVTTAPSVASTVATTATTAPAVTTTVPAAPTTAPRTATTARRTTGGAAAVPPPAPAPEPAPDPGPPPTEPPAPTTPPTTEPPPTTTPPTTEPPTPTTT